jgi:cytochrome c peroxidase
MGKTQLDRELTNGEIEEIVSFLKSLTGKIPEEALSIPVLPATE